MFAAELLLRVGQPNGEIREEGDDFRAKGGLPSLDFQCGWAEKGTGFDCTPLRLDSGIEASTFVSWDRGGGVCGFVLARPSSSVVSVMGIVSIVCRGSAFGVASLVEAAVSTGMCARA